MKISFSFQWVFAIAVVMLSACSTPKNVTDNGINKTLSNYINQISEEKLKEQLGVIASDQMQGRDTGSEGIRKAAQYIVEEYQKQGISYPPQAEGWFQTVPKAYMRNRFNDSDNIWAFIEGSEKPEEILVISAHYDHIGFEGNTIFNGADDNGSGTVAVMELARVFDKAAQEGHRPKRSILFLHVTGEERGLYGSAYYADHPLYPLKNTIANINIDMIGRIGEFHNNGNYIYVIGSDRLSTDLHNINEEVNSKHTKLFLDYKYNDRKDPMMIYYRSDHYNFAKHGIPAVFFFNGLHADYHKETDTVDKIDFKALQKRTQLIFGLAWELANRQERIKVDRDGK
ncbi:M28 family metallopeptidase [Capnocytophaga canimorsus]|uniref:M28 family metallopeptidase n=1 Tax=Capnocytophaga canimorsus TaxID=28188 RepID=UPI001ACBB3D5|nr:M28 family metallopeptidase [Capnocytophaga canimorsus]GIM58892.1 peptidase M28 [Capnocytophaga canimorsus]